VTPIQGGYGSDHLGGLRRFAVAITVFNILGHLVFGFEQSYAQPLVALAAAYGTELLLDYVDAKLNHRARRCAGTPRQVIDSLLSAHITGLAVAMLLYTNEGLLPTMFAASTAIASKAALRAPQGKKNVHFLNPSNFGISVTLLLFGWVGIAPPYHFTENLTGAGDWILPGVIVASGSILNTRFTHRLPLIGAWITAFATQAVVRSVWNDTPVLAALLPMTGVAFVLYTFYMVTDPATTPAAPKAQVAFGAAVAATYGVLVSLHVVFGLFFALSVVSITRGVLLYVGAARRVTVPLRAPEPVRAGEPTFATGDALAPQEALR
jgi:Na+-translocating ferredoxin:NAD+ oxidoreductase RnfD subunit